MRRHTKRKPHVHTTRITLHRGIKKLLDFSKADNLVKLAIDLGLAHAENRAVEIDVLATREFRMKTRADFQERSNAAIDVCAPACWTSDARQDFQKRALAAPFRPIMPTTSPRSISKETSCSAQIWPFCKFLERRKAARAVLEIASRSVL